MSNFEKILSGGDLRSIGKSNSLIAEIKTQREFDELFKLLFHPERVVVMHAADTVEKIAISHPQYLTKHKHKIIQLSRQAKDKELKWHLALLIPRLPLNNKEFNEVWITLEEWTMDKTNSRIVRVNSIQGLFEMMKQNKPITRDFNKLLLELEEENIPSVNARIRKLRNLIAEL